MVQYYTILTTAGEAAIANATVTQTKVNITTLAIGDGNGAEYAPTGTETALRRETWRGPTTQVSIDSDNANHIVVNSLIPSAVGGFVLREFGLYDADGTLIAIANYPETYKPVISDGTVFDLSLDTVIEVNNVDVVEVIVDPNIVTASKKYVDDSVEQIEYKTQDYVSVLSFGVVGDGSDETIKIQQASDYCSENKKILLFPRGEYTLSTIKPLPGILGYEGVDAVLKGILRAPEGIIANGLSDRTDNYFIKGIKFDCNNIARRAIFIHGNNVIVSNNHIVGMSSPSNSTQAIRVYRNSNNNQIFENIIELGVDSPYGKFASLIGINVTGQYYDVYAGLTENDDIIPATNISKNTVIRDNVISGGTHGISLMAAEKSDVYNNKLSYQSHRNIILSPVANYNNIYNNRCEQFGSTGIHCAYGSSYNTIESNYIYSDGTFIINSILGEGAIQLSLHCHHNKIIGNKVHTRSTRYGIRLAHYITNATVINNDINGGSLACIAIMSDTNRLPDPTHKYNIPIPFESTAHQNWASPGNGKPMENITVANNVFHKVYQNNAGIYFLQSQNSPMNNTIIQNNVVQCHFSTGHAIYCHVNDFNIFYRNTIKDNTVTPVDIQNIEFTNKSITLATYLGNNWQDRVRTVTTDTLDFSNANFLSISSALAITDVVGILVSGVMSDRTFVIRLANGATIPHIQNKIRLKGNANAVGTSSNDIIMLRAFSGILFETSRNF